MIIVKENKHEYSRNGLLHVRFRMPRPFCPGGDGVTRRGRGVGGSRQEK